MTVWFTADLHLGHTNIISYSDRPFADVETMNAALIQRWNSAVRPGDTVWVLGDVALGRTEDLLNHIGGLNGHKVLVAGNHDRCWYGRGKSAADWMGRYLDAGFAEIHQGEVSLTIDDLKVIACHFPYRGDSHNEDRYLDHRPTDQGEWLLHGHVHNRWRQWGRMINVGVDAWNCRPVSESELAGIIRLGPSPGPIAASSPQTPL